MRVVCGALLLVGTLLLNACVKGVSIPEWVADARVVGWVDSPTRVLMVGESVWVTVFVPIAAMGEFGDVEVEPLDGGRYYDVNWATASVASRSGLPREGVWLQYEYWYTAETQGVQAIGPFRLRVGEEIVRTDAVTVRVVPALGEGESGQRVSVPPGPARVEEVVE